MPETNVLIGEIPRSETEKILIQIREYKERKYIDCRIHFENDKQEWIPTKKGITLNHDAAQNMIALLQKALTQL
ncbi:MAG: transcriptional coactivator p15/PC4 family protein [Syntrophorhabdaceae bacterium]|nr:transcriptional coactivator p15/PC4 family protein [Syntrophorhabdaceae bacterium]